MVWQFNPYMVVITVAALPAIWLVVHLWPFRKEALGGHFLLFTSLSILLVAAYAVELSVTTLRTMMLAIYVEHLAEVGMVNFLLFTVIYAGCERWITRPRIILLYVVPAIFLFFMFTNDQHGFVWATTGTQTLENGLVFFERTYGPMMFVWVAYNNLIFILGSGLLISRAVKEANIYRGQVTLILIGIAIMWIGSTLTVTRITPYLYLDFTPFSITLGAVPFGISLLYYKFGRLSPISYDQIVRNIIDAVIITDMAENVLYVNPATLNFAHRTQNEIVGRQLARILPEYCPIQTTEIQTLLQRTYGDEVRNYNVTISPLSERKRQRGWIVVVRDVTQTYQAQQQAIDLKLERERVRVMERLICDMSHDFRTPLTLIMSSAPMITMQLERVNSIDDLDRARERISQKVKLIEDNSRHVLKIVHDMMEITRLETNPNPERHLMSFNVLVAEQIGLLQEISVNKTVYMEFFPAQPLPLVRVDEELMGMAIYKLIENAISYTDSGGHVRVTTFADDTHVYVDVEDSGIGIEADDLSRIFERFYRADPTRAPSQGGAGLGLAIARRIINAHDGKISVKSVPNVGSTFRVKIPLQAPSESAEAAEAADTSA